MIIWEVAPALGLFLDQWIPTILDAFLPLLILEIYIPPLRNFHSSPVRVRRLVLTTIETMVFVDNNNLINKSDTKTFDVK